MILLRFLKFPNKKQTFTVVNFHSIQVSNQIQVYKQSIMAPKKDKKAQQVIEQAPKEPQVLQGSGVFQYQNGAVYQGCWKSIDGVKHKHNYGKLTITPKWSQVKQFYQGAWKQDKMQGYGIYHYINGAQYRGQWKENMQNGFGIYIFPNGMSYEGEWRDHLMHGTGCFTIESTKWQGQFRQGKFYTTIQKQLVKQKQLVHQKQILERGSVEFLQKIENALKQEDQVTRQAELQRIFVKKQLVEMQIKSPIYCNYNSFGVQKWKNIIKRMKQSNRRVLTAIAQSKIVDALSVRRQQLSGVGQIIEFSYEKDENDKLNAAMVKLERDLWAIVNISQ